MEPDLAKITPFGAANSWLEIINIYERIFHLEYLPLPGGDSAIHTPAKIALAYLHHYQLGWDR